MSPLDNLLIRACKAKNPYQRLLSLHRRYWLTMSKKDTDKCLALNLGRIIEAHCPPPLNQLIDDLSPRNRWKLSLDEGSDYKEAVWRAFTQHIRCAEVSYFPEFRRPARFRNAA